MHHHPLDQGVSMTQPLDDRSARHRSPLVIDSDPQVLARTRAQKAYRLNVLQIPTLRLLGFSLLGLGALLHNLFLLEPFSWVSVVHLATLLILYPLLSWLIIYLFFERVKLLNLGEFFLVCDIFIYVLIVYFTGGDKSWLFFLVLSRVADHANTSFRKVLVYAHISIVSYVLMLIYVMAVEHHAIAWLGESSKIAVLYGVSLYLALATRTVEQRHLRTSDAIRVARELIFQLEEQSTQLAASKSKVERLSRHNALILGSAGEGIYGLDLRGHLTFINPAAANMLGWEAEDVIGRPMHRMLHPLPPEGASSRRQTAPDAVMVPDEAVHQGENGVFWRKDGTSFPVEYTSTPIRENGALVGAVIVFKDITERKRVEEALHRAKDELEARVQERTAALATANAALRAEVAERRRAHAALRDREERLRLALQAGQMGTWEWDIRTGALRWSTELEPLHGFAPGSFPGTYEAFLGIISPEDRPRFVQAVARTLETGTAFEAEFRILWPDGSLHWMAGRGQVFYDDTGQPVHMLGVGIEVTARKRVEGEAEQRRRETEVLAHLAQSLNASLELDLVLQRVAEGARELCGSERALIMLRAPGDEALVSRYQVGFAQMPYVDLRIEPGKGMGGWVLATGCPLRTADYAADPRFSKEYVDRLRTDGRLAVITVPIIIGPRVEGVLYVSNPAARPFTARHEDVLLHLADHAATAIRNAQLYHAAQDELARRTQAEAQLQASLREKEVLLQEIHHRVKNNLQIVSSLLNLQVHAVHDPQLRTLLHDSQQRIQAMALIHEALYQAHDLAQVPLAAYVRQLAAQLFHAYDGAARRLSLTVQADPVTLDIDRAAPCGLILTELFSNALQHAFPGGGPGTIAVVLRGAAHQVALSVRDSGVGFPPAFDVGRADSLGLKLVAMLTKQLDGTLTQACEGGTTLTLAFPLPPSERTRRSVANVGRRCRRPGRGPDEAART
jgi:PAS domain S-box-containing protein